MAPERFSGHCDARSDVYSLGLTLYELIALRPAYEAPDRHRLMERVLQEEPERLKKRAPGVPRDLETIVAKATARDPALRYATAGALAEDLRRFIEDRPIRARRISQAERLARWCRRNKLVASALGIAAAALLAVAGLSIVYARRQARHAAEQAPASQQIGALASRLEKEGAKLKDERDRFNTGLSESKSRLARLDLERGLAAFEKGEIGAGMLWTGESIKMASEAGDATMRHVALANLAAWRRSHAQVQQVFSHDGGVAAVAFSPDGKTIATASWDWTARLWNVATGREIGPPMRQGNLVWSLTYSPDGKTIISAGWDKTARLWDVATGRQIGPNLQHTGFTYGVAFSPDGKMVASTGADEMVRLWDAATGRPLSQPIVHAEAVYAVAFSPGWPDDRERIREGSPDLGCRDLPPPGPAA